MCFVDLCLLPLNLQDGFKAILFCTSFIRSTLFPINILIDSDPFVLRKVFLFIYTFTEYISPIICLNLTDICLNHQLQRSSRFFKVRFQTSDPFPPIELIQLPTQSNTVFRYAPL